MCFVLVPFHVPFLVSLIMNPVLDEEVNSAMTERLIFNQVCVTAFPSVSLDGD